MTPRPSRVHVLFVFAAPDPAALSLPQRLEGVLNPLRRHLALWAVRDRSFAPLLLLLWNRLARLVARFTVVAGRHRDGAIRQRRSPAPRGDGAAPSRNPPPRDKLPRQRGWLVRRVPLCGPYGEYLRRLIAEPEMVALLEASPEARRLIRPLWRMLRREKVPDILRPPAAAPAPSNCKPRTGKPRTGKPRTGKPRGGAPRTPAQRRTLATLLPGYRLKRV